ncbi:MAG: NirD/YgiW/YdeI family stress tolerance protein [Oscillatoriales cyanobacterium RU_3_3]|nr:NirD/YgiW/YdeI family stress tolerance protein [Oscillatoriales cyanobacterium RU_3_3]
MKKIILLACTCAVFTLNLQGPALAQTSIQELQRHRGTTISGTITSVVGNEFILSDGTGEIIVDAGPRWYRQINLRVGEKVSVVGDYDDDDFDAYSIRRQNGEVIQIRNGPGRPPWAGGRGRD